MNTIFPNTSPASIAAKPSRASDSGRTRSISGPHPARLAQPREPRELVAGAHRRADDAELEEEHALELGGRREAAGARPRRPASRPAAARAASASTSPRRRSRARRPRAPAAARRSRTPRAAPSSTARSPLRLVAATSPRRAGRPGGASTIAALATPPPAPWISTVSPGCTPAFDEQHPVGGQPRGRQARRPPRTRAPPAWARGCARGTATRSASVPWCCSDSSVRFGSSVSSPRQSSVGDHRVHDHLVAVGVDAGGVAAEDHRQPVLGQADPAQRPQVVVVERSGADLDGRPARPAARVRAARRPPARRAGRRRWSLRRRRRACALAYPSYSARNVSA